MDLLAKARETLKSAGANPDDPKTYADNKLGITQDDFKQLAIDKVREHFQDQQNKVDNHPNPELDLLKKPGETDKQRLDRVSNAVDRFDTNFNSLNSINRALTKGVPNLGLSAADLQAAVGPDSVERFRQEFTSQGALAANSHYQLAQLDQKASDRNQTPGLLPGQGIAQIQQAQNIAYDVYPHIDNQTPEQLKEIADNRAALITGGQMDGKQFQDSNITGYSGLKTFVETQPSLDTSKAPVIQPSKPWRVF